MSATPIVRIVAPLFSTPVNAKAVVVPPSGCWKSRRPVPAVALVSAAGPVIVNTIAESAPEFGEVNRILNVPGPDAVGPSPPQLAPVHRTAASKVSMTDRKEHTSELQ